jgi:hypothetical protein
MECLHFVQMRSKFPRQGISHAYLDTTVVRQSHSPSWRRKSPTKAEARNDLKTSLLCKVSSMDCPLIQRYRPPRSLAHHAQRKETTGSYLDCYSFISTALKARSFSARDTHMPPTFVLGTPQDPSTSTSLNKSLTVFFNNHFEIFCHKRFLVATISDSVSRYTNMMWKVNLSFFDKVMLAATFKLYEENFALVTASTRVAAYLHCRKTH